LQDITNKMFERFAVAGGRTQLWWYCYWNKNWRLSYSSWQHFLLCFPLLRLKQHLDKLESIFFLSLS